MEGEGESRKTKRGKNRLVTKENNYLNPKDEKLEKLAVKEEEVKTRRINYNLRSDKKHGKLNWIQDQEDHSNSGQVLLNPIILRNTFKYFSTSFLLSSCSLVSKTWNRIARTFIRSSRKCTAKIREQNCANICQVVKNLEALCSEAVKHGRHVPFNGLEIELSGDVEECPKDSGCDGVFHHVSLPSEINLKFLDIIAEWFDGTCHQIPETIRALIRNRGSEIQDMNVPGVGFLKVLLIDQSLNFPVLQNITLSRTTSFDPPVAVQRNILRNMHLKSPNLKKIFLESSHSVDILPNELYGLLGNMGFFLQDLYEKECPWQDILAQNPKLRELTIYESSELNHHHHHLLTQLLISCKDSLEEFELHVDGFHALPLMSSNALKNLSTLSLEIGDEERIQVLWNALVSIDSDQMIPKLEKVKIHLNLHTKKAIQWPASHTGKNIRHSYNSVRQLELRLPLVACNMLEIKAVFPHLTSLDLSLHEPERLLCREFWELWPNLRELEISGWGTTLRQNYDAEFCGINEEEAEMLRNMDDEYLRTVQIVPIRPSLLTLPNLRKLLMEFTFRIDSKRPLLAFISNLTKLVAFRQLPSKDVSVTCNMRKRLWKR